MNTSMFRATTACRSETYQQRLVDLWIEYQDKVALDKRDALPLRPIYFLAPGE